MPSRSSGHSSNWIPATPERIQKIYRRVDDLIEGQVRVDIASQQGLEQLAYDIADCQGRLQELVQIYREWMRGVRIGGVVLHGIRKTLDMKIKIYAVSDPKAKWAGNIEARLSLARKGHKKEEEDYQKKEVFLEEIKALKEHIEEGIRTLKRKKEALHEEVELAKLRVSLAH